MSEKTRPKPTRMTVCDLCDSEIPDGEPSERGSLTGGCIAYEVTPKTRHAWLMWPPSERKRRTRLEEQMRRKEEFRERHYDFHAECILRLVESAIATRGPASVPGRDGLEGK